MYFLVVKHVASRYEYSIFLVNVHLSQVAVQFSACLVKAFVIYPSYVHVRKKGINRV